MSACGGWHDWSAMASCSHLDQVQLAELPESVEGCEDCLKTRRSLAASADLPELRSRRLLRQLAEPSRLRPRGGERARSDPLARAGRGLVLVLRGPDRDARSPPSPARRASRRPRSGAERWRRDSSPAASAATAAGCRTTRRPDPARPVPRAGVPGPDRRPDARDRHRRSLELRDRRDGRRRATVVVGRVQRAAARGGAVRHPLRHEVVEARHELPRRLGRRAARGGRAARRLRDGLLASAATRPTSRSRT